MTRIDAKDQIIDTTSVQTHGLAKSMAIAITRFGIRTGRGLSKISTKWVDTTTHRAHYLVMQPQPQR
ncbi:hypothetical protein LCGC14_1341190 [marine sediment metagenome]|uniref:Uncharacterized protein n=1 Tax=marine sediment metagenome TaxID=412755 RepID=A0A0F9MUL6_9ZZZZ